MLQVHVRAHSSLSVTDKTLARVCHQSYTQLPYARSAHVGHARGSDDRTAHSPLSTGLATVNALSQSIFEYRRPESRSTNRFTPATAVKHAKKIETKNENVSSEKPVFGLKKRCRRVVGKWTKSPKKLDGSPS